MSLKGTRQEEIILEGVDREERNHAGEMEMWERKEPGRHEETGWRGKSTEESRQMVSGG